MESGRSGASSVMGNPLSVVGAQLVIDEGHTPPPMLADCMRPGRHNNNTSPCVELAPAFVMMLIAGPYVHP
jgi:hypothetical protein